VTYTINEFREFLESFAVYDTVIPKDEDTIMADIPMPMDNLVCRVDTGVNIYSSEYEGGDAAIMLYNPRQDNVADKWQLDVDENSWQDEFESNIRKMVANWREYVL